MNIGLAIQFFHKGQHAEAKKILEELVIGDPNNFLINEYLGYLAGVENNFKKAYKFLMLATSDINSSPESFYYLAQCCLHLGDEVAATNNYLEAVRRDQNFLEAWNDLMVLYSKLGNFTSAKNCLKKIIALNPIAVDSLYGLAELEFQDGNFEEANLYYGQAININPSFVEAWSNKGNTLHQLKRYEEALLCCDQAININPNLAEGWLNKGNTLHQLKRYEEALFCCDQAININPNFAEAWSNKGNTLHQLARCEEALLCCDQAIKINPNYASPWSNKGSILLQLNRHKEAILCCDQAIKIDPKLVNAIYMAATILLDSKQYKDAVVLFRKTLDLEKDHYKARGRLFSAKLAINQWDGYESELEAIKNIVYEGEECVNPLIALAIFEEESLCFKSAKTFISNQISKKIVNTFGVAKEKKRIRVGYFSGDFRNHAVYHLVSEVFELHDKDSFEIYAFVLNDLVDKSIRKKLEDSFDKVYEAFDMKSIDIARLAIDAELDIAIDLAGHTKDGATDIFSYRVAPVQVNYLGYPGTIAAEFMDYIIADKIIIPDDSQEFYSEKIIYLPDTYQPNDSNKKISDHQFAKSELGLPDDGMIYCCFNNSYKINPKTFSSWMEILRAVDGSVLWLLADNPLNESNLVIEAAKYGISKERLIFAKRVDLPMHLARHRQADLFLDTLPYNAHTTASDALWAGLPVLTMMGKTFAGKVAASLLNAIGLNEMVVNTKQEYIDLAIYLGKNKVQLDKYKSYLSDARLKSSLFDSKKYVKNLESAYKLIYQRRLANLPPENIHVLSI